MTSDIKECVIAIIALVASVLLFIGMVLVPALEVAELFKEVAEHRQKPTTITMMNLCRLDGSVLGTTENGIKIMRIKSS